MNIVKEFQKKYPTKCMREEALRKMSNEEIDKLIAGSGIIQSKIYYESFKKKNKEVISNK